jgi:hypothetical protein
MSPDSLLYSRRSLLPARLIPDGLTAQPTQPLAVEACSHAGNVVLGAVLSQAAALALDRLSPSLLVLRMRWVSWIGGYL